MGQKFKVGTVIFFFLILFLISLVSVAKFVSSATEFATGGETDVLATTSNTASIPTPTVSQKEYSGKVEDSETDIGELIGLGKDQVKVKNADIQKPAGKATTITLTPGKGSIKIKNKEGVWKEYSNLDKLKVIENGKDKIYDAKMVINANGEIQEAYFTSVNGGKYDFENERIDIPKGGAIIYRKGTGKELGKAQVSVPANTKIIPPDAISANGKRIEVSYRTWDNGLLELPNGYKIKGAIVSYTGNQISFIGESAQGEVSVDNMRIKKSSDNPEWVKTYLDFNGEVSKSYDSAYVSFNKDKGKVVIGSNIDKSSPAVTFTEANPYGLLLEKGDNFAVQVKGDAKGAYFSIEDRTKLGKTPLVETLNGFSINQDNGGFYYEGTKGQVYLRSTGPVVKEFGDNFAGSSSVPMEIRSYKTGANGEKVEVKNSRVLVVDNSNKYGYGPNPNFIRINYYKQYPKLATGVSNYLFYNYALTKEGFERFSGVNLIAEDSEATQWLSKPNNIKYLYDIMESVPQQQMKMIKNIFLQDSYWDCHAYADGDGIHMAVYDNLNGDVMRHEMAHIVDFEDGAGSFRSQWDGKGLNQGPHTYDYGYTDMEDISTFLEIFAYGDDATVKEYLDNSNPNHAIWRARVAVAYDNYYFTKSRMEEIYRGAGLPYDDSALNKYRNLQE